MELLIKEAGKRVADPEQIKNILTELETSFEQFQKAEKKFWEDLK